MGNHRISLAFIGKRLLRLLILFVLVAFFVLVAGIGCADRLIFFPPPAKTQETERIYRVSFPNIGNLGVYTALAPNPDAYVVLYSHGNAEDLFMLEEYLAEFPRQGWSIVAYDYEGYGLSDGAPPSEGKSYRDILALYRWLTRTMKIPPEKIVIYGRSVGSGPACWLAANEKAAALILEAPFLSTFRVVLPFSLPFDRFPNASVIGRVRCPVLIIHGTKDEVIPFEHGKRLFELVKAPKGFVPVEGAGHNNIREYIPATYWEELKNFQAMIKANRY